MELCLKVCAMTHLNTCDVTRSYICDVTHLHVTHDSFIRALRVVRCSALLCVAVHCLCVAVYCCVLQCVAVRCSVARRRRSRLEVRDVTCLHKSHLKET